MKKNLSIDCKGGSCMECGAGDDCDCSCHGWFGLEAIPKEPIKELIAICRKTRSKEIKAWLLKWDRKLR